MPAESGKVFTVAEEEELRKLEYMATGQDSAAVKGLQHEISKEVQGLAAWKLNKSQLLGVWLSYLGLQHFSRLGQNKAPRQKTPPD